MTFSFQTAKFLSWIAAPCWFTDYMNSNLQVLNQNVQAIDSWLQNSDQVADQRFKALQQQIESVQRKIDDNANAILSVTTGFSKFSDTLMTVQCKFNTLQNRCDERMSTLANVGSDNTDMKHHSQSHWSVDTTMTYSQQSSVCSTLGIESPGYQASSPLPACYPYPNTPSSIACTQPQSALPASYNMHVPPSSNVSVALLPLKVWLQLPFIRIRFKEIRVLWVKIW